MKNASDNVSVPHEQGIHVNESVVIHCPAQRLYDFWHNFEQLPSFMDHLEKVQRLSGGRSHWVAKAPVGMEVEWYAEVINDVPDEVIAWRSLEGSQIPNAGSVRFNQIGVNSTEVQLEMEYLPPAGKLGQAVAALLGQDPAKQVSEDLDRLKKLMESDRSSM